MVSLAIDPPPNARRERPSRGPAVVGVVVAVVASFGGGFWLGRVTAPAAPVAAPPPPAAPSTPTAAAPSIPAATPTPTETATAPAPATATGTGTATPTAVAPTTATPTLTSLTTPAPPVPAIAGTLRRLTVVLDGSLEQSISRALPAEDRAHAEELSAVVNRLLVWDMLVSRDGRKGDRLQVLWTPAAPAAPGLPVTGEPVVLALRYASSKLGSVLATYRYEPKGARWARYYRFDGTELEARLVDAPIGEYEQVTSLLRDGRRHKGVDFKAPVGSPVVSPFDGVIDRRNWNFATNGNCLDVRDPATGRHAIFLHLDVVPKEMQPGRRVKKGEVIAASGNSGRSYAPHLHYQLEDAAGRVLDPFETLRSERRALPAAEKVSFDAARARLDALLGT